MKYLKMNLLKKVKDFYIEKYGTPKKKGKNMIFDKGTKHSLEEK